MTHEEFEYLQSDVACELTERYIGCEPTRVALATGSAVVATRIKNLQKCRHKLPSYYAARCIVSTISYEQSSSEYTAAAREFSGALALDLTLGLGVDSLYLAKNFERVIAVEIDPLRAAVARYNFAKLNVTNVEVVNGSAEEFLANFDSRADLIYIDPSRRGASGESLYAVEQCAPNVIELLDMLRAKSRRVTIKLSPLFDVAQTYRLFGEDASCEVVTLDDECKEVLVHIAAEGVDNPLRVTAVRDGGVSRYDFAREDVGYRGEKNAVDAQYICVADVGFYKSRTVEALMRGQGGYTFEGGYLFTEQPPPNFCGRVYRIEQQMPYNPKMLRGRFPRAIVHKRDFPYDTNKLGIKQGVLPTSFFAEGDTAGSFFSNFAPMKRVIIITILACLPLALFCQRGSRSLGRKFSPIYGSDADINRTLTFISENFTFDSLTYTRLGNLKGYVHCRFFVEKDGSVVDVQIARGLAYWIDYEIVAGMKALPKMEPFKDRTGGALKVRREVFFTFNNSEEDRFSKLPNYSDHQQQDPEIERQRKEQIERGIAQNSAWNKFTDDNTKLSLDGKSIYKPGTLSNNPLKITPPPTRPPINVTIKAE